MKNHPEDVNGDLRDDHCLGTMCNGMSVPDQLADFYVDDVRAGR